MKKFNDRYEIKLQTKDQKARVLVTPTFTKKTRIVVVWAGKKGNHKEEWGEKVEKVEEISPAHFAFSAAG